MSRTREHRHRRGFHLAQTNLAEVRFGDVNAPQLADFHAALDPVHAVAEATPGFVWRMHFDYSDPANRPVIFGRDDYLFTLSVWEDLEGLRGFVYGGAHAEIMARRREWFERHTESYMGLWWIPAGTLPTVRDAEERLASLRAKGSTPFAFTFREPFPMPAEM
jgi:hypothetical protein